MTRFRSTLVALGAMAILSAPAMAQGQGRGQGRGPGMGGMMGRMASIQLLSAPAVHKELGLSDEQAEKLQALAAEFRETTMSRFGEMRDLSPEQRQAKSAEILAEIEKKMAEEVKATLDEKQLDRFEQLRVQGMGLHAFAHPKVEEKLKLTEDQKATIEGLASDLESDSREAFMAAREDGPEGMRAASEKIAKLGKDALAKAADTLTDEQKTAWKELVGEPFELPTRMGLGGRGGPGGGRPGGGRPRN